MKGADIDKNAAGRNAFRCTGKGRKAGKLGIKARVILAFLLFTAVIIGILWVFQIILLDDFYKTIKTDEIKSLADRISVTDISDITDIIESDARYKDICVVISDTTGRKLVALQTESFPFIRVLDEERLKKLYEHTENSGGTYFKYYRFRDDPRSEVIGDQPPEAPEPPASGETAGKNVSADQNDKYPRILNPQIGSGFAKYNDAECLMYCAVQKRMSGEKCFLVLSTVISPVNAAKSTLFYQLVFLTVILIVLSVVMSAVIAKSLSNSIIVLNREAKYLPAGRFKMPEKDISFKEVKELADTLEDAADEISKVEALRKELIANVSHDLRTPLTLIAGYSELMRDIPGENTAENLQIVIDETNRLNDLVTDMLDISRLESGMYNTNPETLSLTELVKNILFRYDKLVENGGYVITFNYDEEVYVSVDNTKLSQVVYNLVNNAINYCGDDKKVTVNQKLIAGGKKVKFEVIDSGEGIAPENLPLIWDRYYKADNAHKRASVGSGLGLSIVKKVLEMHGAEYGVESELGKGSCFWFILDTCSPDKRKNCETPDE